MKRSGAIAAIVFLMVLSQTAVSFAAGLEIIDSSPKDGAKGRQPVNFAVKLYFNQDVRNPENRAINDACFEITDAEGNIQPIKIFYHHKEEGLVLIVLNDILEEDADYSLSVSGDFTASSGDALGEDRIISFRTRNTKNDITASMIMMGVMFAGILLFSTRQMKRQAQKEAESKEEKVNPYKVSKATGKSVKEIVEKTEKQKQKKAAEEAKKRGEPEEDEETQAIEWETNDNKRVKGPRPVSAGGSSYKSGGKAKAEAEAKRLAEAKAAGTTRPKNQKGKSKSKSKKK